MKYDVENLLKIREDNILLKCCSGVGLSNTIVKAINIKRELEKIDEVLLSPSRTESDIMTHAGLVKEYGENRKRQIAILDKSKDLLGDIAVKLEKDYEETVKIIKG